MALDGLNIEQLKEVVDSRNYADLNDRYKQLLPPRDQLFNDDDMIGHDRALEEAISESTMPIDTYWCFLAIAVGAGVTQLYLAMFAFLLALGYYMHNCGAAEQTHRERVNDDIRFFQLQQLRIQAADKLCTRLRAENKNCKSYQFKDPSEVLDAKPTPPSIAGSLFTGLKVGLCFFGGYYLSAAWICEAVGLAVGVGLMLTPWGMAVAGLLALSLAAYCAYDHYKATQSAEMIETKKTQVSRIVDTKKDECNQLYGIYKSDLRDSSKDEKTSRELTISSVC